MECGYKVKLLGQNEQFFDSDELLDKWVLDNFFKNPKNLERLRKYTKGKNILFDSKEEANNHSRALEALDKISEELLKRSDRHTFTPNLDFVYDEENDIWDIEAQIAEQYENLVSVTNYLNAVGNRSDLSKPSVTGSNQDAYEAKLADLVEVDMRKNEYDKWIKTYGDSEESKAQWESKVKAKKEEIIKKYRQKREYAQLIGDDIHKIMETLAYEKSGNPKKLPPGHILTKKDQELYYPECKKIFDEVCKRYKFSDNAVFLPEFTIFGKNIDSPTKRVLKEKLGKDIDGLLGRIDLLVIDKGKAYVFDFKTTAEKEVGDWSEMDNEILAANGWWTSSKKLEAMRQISMYLAILNEWGIEPGCGEVIPITINYDNDSDGYPQNIKTIRIDNNGKHIVKADSSNDNTNIKGLYLDRSTEKWGSESFKASSAKLIMYKYLPEAMKKIGPIKPLDVNECIELDEDEELMFPSGNGNERAKEFEATVNFYLGKDENGKKVRPSRLVELSSDDPDKFLRGYLYKMYISPKVDAGFGEGKPILFKSNDESEVIPKIQKYCDALNKARHEEFNTFAKNLLNIMQIKGRDISEIDAASTALVGNDPRKKEYIKHMFQKYMIGDWDLYGANDLNNPLIRRGIFIFYKNDVIEVVCLTHDHLHYEVNFGTKRNPKKSVLNGLTSEKMDPYVFLSSSKGNIALMKALNIISKDPNIYRNGGAKIQKVIAINPWMMLSNWSDNDTLYENWKAMCFYSNGKLKTLSKNNFVSPVEAALEEAKDILMESSIWSYIENNFENTLQNEEDVIKLINIIKKKSSVSFNDDGTPDISNTVGYGVWCLLNALNLKRNLRLPIEHDVGKILEGGVLPVGAFVNSPGNAVSTTIRTLDVLTASFKLKYEELTQDRAKMFNKHIEKIYKLLNYNPNLQSRKDFWSQFFVKENGVVSKQMRIVSFSNKEFWNNYNPEVQISIKFILDTLAQYKNIPLTKSAPTYAQSDPDKYYEMPLTKGTFVDSLKKVITKDGARGVLDLAKDRIKKFKNKTQDLYFGDETIYQQKNDENVDLLQPLTNRYCQYTAEQRATWCQNDYQSYTTDFEEILGNVVVAQSIYESSKLYGFLYAGLKTALTVNEKLGGEEVPELKEYIEKYITRIYKGQNIMDTSLLGAAEIINALKGITSKMALGFNTRAFTREFLVSWYIGTIRSNNNKIDGVEGEDFAFGLKYVLSHAPANLKKTELLGQLNKRFGMVEQSRSELPKSNFLNDFALKTVDMDQLSFMGTTLPDNWFRMAIVVARMHADGCLEAYDLDENGVLKYDARKDERFNKYLTNDETPIFKKYDTSMGSMSAYLDAKSIWDSYLNEWKTQKQDSSLLTLPEAYPPKIIRTLQHQAGELYGFFDEDQRSLMCSQFIGSAIMQYKTWLSSKIDQWLKRPGFANIWRQVHVTNENGKKMYVLTHSAEEIRNGKSPIEFITEDQITQEMINNGKIVPYVIEQGTYTEGMIQSTINFAASILTWNWDEFLNMWKNDPVARGNFICGFIDMFGMMLFAGLVKLIFGEDTVNNKSAQPWFTQWTYGVLIGFAEDGPIHQVLGSMVGDWNPPSLLTVKRLAQTTQSVLQGNKTVPQGFIESFGATKEFSGFFRQ